MIEHCETLLWSSKIFKNYGFYVCQKPPQVNSFRDLAHFAQYVTDWCSASLKSCSLCWSPTRGVFAQMECCQKADQERVISKLMTELYGDKRLSVSSVTGGDYQGQSEKSYRVDWSVVASEAAVAGIEQKEADKLQKLEKLARKAAEKMQKKKDKKGKKKDKKGKKDKKKKKDKKDKKDKKSKKEKKCKEESRVPTSQIAARHMQKDESSEEKPKVEAADPPDGEKFAWETSSSSSSEEPPAKKPKEVDVKSLGPMAMLAGSDEESSGSWDEFSLCRRRRQLRSRSFHPPTRGSKLLEHLLRPPRLCRWRCSPGFPMELLQKLCSYCTCLGLRKKAIDCRRIYPLTWAYPLRPVFGCFQRFSTSCPIMSVGLSWVQASSLIRWIHRFSGHLATAITVGLGPRVLNEVAEQTNTKFVLLNGWAKSASKSWGPPKHENLFSARLCS